MDVLTFKLSKNYTDSVVSMPVTNILENGNFDDVTGWKESKSTRLVSDNILTFTASEKGGYVAHDLPALTLGHVYYAGLFFKTTSGAGVTMSVVQGLTPWTTLMTKIYTATGGYARISNIGTVVDNSTTYGIRILDSRNSDWDAIEIKKAVVIDLTATFGAGNEPTSTEMDALLAYFPSSWFDGTRNISPALAVLCLNKLRNLETLVTALGGS